jgi:membrane fusion protein, heavy metal efflux system
MNLTHIFLLFLTLAFAGCQRAKESAEAPAPQVEAGKVIFPADSPQVTALVSEPARMTQARGVRLTGRIVWDEDVTVRIFSAFGGRVTRIVAPLGQRIEKDAPLAFVASPDFGVVQADAAKAALDLRLSEQTLARLKDLASYGAAAQKDLLTAEIEFTRAQAEAARVARRLELFGGAAHSSDQEFALRTPLAGVVVERNINPGQQVSPDQINANGPALFVVTDPTQLWVVLDASEQALPLLKPGVALQIHTPTWAGDGFAARIEHVADAVDATSRTIRVRAMLENPERKLKAEMFVTAELAVAAPAGVEVPAAAVFLRGENNFVFVREAAGAYRKRMVKIGEEHDGWTHVVSGLAPGESVVRDGALMLDQILTDAGKP